VGECELAARDTAWKGLLSTDGSVEIVGIDILGGEIADLNEDCVSETGASG
jgi:hypothetical protein